MMTFLRRRSRVSLRELYAGVICLGVMTMAALIILGAWVLASWQDSELRHKGQSTTATVTTHFYSEENRIEYSFTDELGAPRHGSTSLPSDFAPAKGGALTIRYLRNKPDVSRSLYELEHRNLWTPCMLFVFLAIVGTATVIYVRWIRQAQRAEQEILLDGR